MAFPQDESWNFHEMSRGVYMQRSGKPTRNFDVVTRGVVQSRSLCNASVGARNTVNILWLVTAFTVQNLFTIELCRLTLYIPVESHSYKLLTYRALTD